MPVGGTSEGIARAPIGWVMGEGAPACEGEGVLAGACMGVCANCAIFAIFASYIEETAAEQRVRQHTDKLTTID